MVQVLFGGDSHGDLNYLEILIDKAVRFDVPIVFILGDFGYWEHSPDGALFLTRLQEHLASAGITLIFIDGNHDNHPLLWHRYQQYTDDGFIIIRPNLLYAPRGHTWQWGMAKMLSIGGAYSIDKDWRVGSYNMVYDAFIDEGYSHSQAAKAAEPYEMWWPTELITPEDKQRCMNVGKVDVVLSHDVGTDVDMNKIMISHGRSNIKTDLMSYKNRMELQDIIDVVEPWAIHHGHWHVRYNDKVHGRTYHGYDCNLRVSDAWNVVTFN